MEYTVPGQVIKTPNNVTIIGYTDMPSRMATQVCAGSCVQERKCGMATQGSMATQVVMPECVPVWSRCGTRSTLLALSSHTCVPPSCHLSLQLPTLPCLCALIIIKDITASVLSKCLPCLPGPSL